jgi:hypothetical protein
MINTGRSDPFMNKTLSTRAGVRVIQNPHEQVVSGEPGRFKLHDPLPSCQFPSDYRPRVGNSSALLIESRQAFTSLVADDRICDRGSGKFAASADRKALFTGARIDTTTGVRIPWAEPVDHRAQTRERFSSFLVPRSGGVYRARA